MLLNTKRGKMSLYEIRFVKNHRLRHKVVLKLRFLLQELKFRNDGGIVIL